MSASPVVADLLQRASARTELKRNELNFARKRHWRLPQLICRRWFLNFSTPTLPQTPIHEREARGDHRRLPPRHLEVLPEPVPARRGVRAHERDRTDDLLLKRRRRKRKQNVIARTGWGRSRVGAGNRRWYFLFIRHTRTCRRRCSPLLLLGVLMYLRVHTQARLWALFVCCSVLCVALWRSSEFGCLTLLSGST